MGRSDDAQACIRSALRRRRRTLGLTQEAAAHVLGMSRLTYHRIEIGRRRVQFTELAAICAAFNCHIGELVQDGQLANAFVNAAKALLGDAQG
jgi:transcriptional regulator with XRE-family HTH domain